MGVELTGKTLGLIGCGNIGSIVADRAIGLKMKVIAFDPFLSAERAVDARRREGRARRAAAPRRLHHAAHAADRQDPQHPRRRGARQDEEGRAHHQLRPRRPGRRGGAAPTRSKSGHVAGAALRRVRRGAGQGQPAVRPAERRLHAASRRLHHRGAGERGAAGGRADVATTCCTGAITNALNFPSITAEEAPRAEALRRRSPRSSAPSPASSPRAGDQGHPHRV